MSAVADRLNDELDRLEDELTQLQADCIDSSAQRRCAFVLACFALPHALRGRTCDRARVCVLYKVTRWE
jgi:hypothetical protein